MNHNLTFCAIEAVLAVAPPKYRRAAIFGDLDALAASADNAPRASIARAMWTIADARTACVPSDYLTIGGIADTAREHKGALDAKFATAADNAMLAMALDNFDAPADWLAHGLADAAYQLDFLALLRNNKAFAVSPYLGYSIFPPAACNDFVGWLGYAPTFAIHKGEAVVFVDKTGDKRAMLDAADFVRRFCPKIDKRELNSFIAAAIADGANHLLFVGNDQPAAWQQVYRNGYQTNSLQSCMANQQHPQGCPAVQNYACMDSLPPEEAENNSHFQLAFILNKHGVCGRAPVNMRKRQYPKVYGGEPMRRALQAFGFTEEDDALRGFRAVLAENADGLRTAPYLDGCNQRAFEEVIGSNSYLRFHPCGDALMNTTSGIYAPDEGTRCTCCGNHVSDDEIGYASVIYCDELQIDYDSPICEDCLNRDYTQVHYRREWHWVSDNDIAITTDGERIPDNGVIAYELGYLWLSGSCEYVPADDYVFSDYEDDYIHIDYAQEIEFECFLADDVAQDEESGLWYAPHAYNCQALNPYLARLQNCEADTLQALTDARE